MKKKDLTFFTAGHGLYNFHIDRNTFERSLYYNLLLQPFIAIPDHFLLQGTYIFQHLSQRRSRDTWLEIALKNGFMIPFFRSEQASLRKILPEMRSTGLKGFTSQAEGVAERLDGIYPNSERWDPKNNSEIFRHIFEKIFKGIPPILPRRIWDEHLDYGGFWVRSEHWRQNDINMARELAIDKETLPLSLLIQATAYRILGKGNEHIISVGDLLTKLKNVGLPHSELEDIRIFYTLACEYYNRALAESVLASPNSPKWTGYLAALDFDLNDRDNELSTEIDQDENCENTIETEIELPILRVLKSLSGDCLLEIRRHQTFERYIQALSKWKSSPNKYSAEILTAELKRYSEVIRKKVGDEISTEQLQPKFLTRIGGIVEFVEKIPDPYLFALFAFPKTPDFLKTTALFLFCLKRIEKHRTSPKKYEVKIKPNEAGLIFCPDTTLLKKEEV